MADYNPGVRRFQRLFIYPLQALFAMLIYGFFACLPMKAASGFGGWLARQIGPRLGITRRAEKNIRRALPEFDDTQVKKTIRDMWDNLGRVVGEMPHITRLARSEASGDIEIVNREILESIRDSGKPCIFFSGHFANWEIFALVAHQLRVPYAQVYRAANNPLVDRMLRRIRRLEDDDIVPKGPEGARKALQVLKDGRRLGMLVDQKMNDGIAVPFFGRDAMTAPALAQLSLRFDCPAIPVRIERLEGCRFRLTLYPPLSVENTGDRQQVIEAMMREVNSLFESWIRERPGQWLWPHSRWPDS